MSNQLDMFEQPGEEKAKAFSADQVSAQYKPPEGPPEYQAAWEMINFVSYTKLNDWQKKVLWPHLKFIRDEVMKEAVEKKTLQFELGYIVGALEIEQLRSRTAAREICNKYGVTF